MEDREYFIAVCAAAEQTGRVIVRVICGACPRSRQVGTVTRRPRGLYYRSERPTMQGMELEVAFRSWSRGHQVDPGHAKLFEVRRYLPAPGWVGPCLDVWQELLDLAAPGRRTAAWCPEHGAMPFAVAHLTAVAHGYRAKGGRPLRFSVTPDC